MNPTWKDLYKQCGITNARGGLMAPEIAAYIKLMRRDIARGTVRSQYEIRWQPDIGGGRYPFTHAQAMLCIEELQRYAQAHPGPGYP